jgi:hypothetical protein
MAAEPAVLMRDDITIDTDLRTHLLPRAAANPARARVIPAARRIEHFPATLVRDTGPWTANSTSRGISVRVGASRRPVPGAPDAARSPDSTLASEPSAEQAAGIGAATSQRSATRPQSAVR